MRTCGFFLQLCGMAFMPVALIIGLTQPEGFLVEIALGATGILCFLAGRYLERDPEGGGGGPAEPGPRDDPGESTGP